MRVLRTKAPLLDFFLAAEPEQLRACATRPSSARGWIVSVQNGEIVRLLVFENARFGVDVIRESLVAVEMVGRDVEDDGDARTKVDDGLQLKAGDFENDPGFGRGLIDKSDGRRADVAADERREIFRRR